MIHYHQLSIQYFLTTGHLICDVKSVKQVFSLTQDRRKGYKDKESGARSYEAIVVGSIQSDGAPDSPDTEMVGWKS